MYKVGDKIVYPMHGAGVIEDIEEMDIFDKKQTYYKVTIASEGMEILIPVDKADEVGLRDIPNHEDIEKMFEVLGQPQDRMTSNWSKRYQDNMDQMKTGDLLDVARVTRNLAISRLRERGAQKRGRDEIAALLDELSECLPGGEEPERALEGRELAAAIDRFLGTLRKEEREMFVARVFFAAPTAELARRTGSSEAKISSQLQRTRKKLKQYLTEEGLW